MAACLPPNKIVPTKQSINRNCLCNNLPRPPMNVVAGSAEAASPPPVKLGNVKDSAQEMSSKKVTQDKK